MNEEIRALVESLRRGQYEDPAEKIALLTAALQEHSADIQLLESLFKAPQIALRLAALEACHGRTEPELVKELVKLADDPESRVREKLPRVLDGRETSATLHALRCLTQDVEAAVRKAAIGATGGIAGFREIQQTLLESDPDWEVRMAAAIALATQRDPIVAFHLFKALAEDDDKDISQKCGELIEKRLLANRTATEKQLPQEISLLSRAEGRLKNLGGERFRHLLTWITTKTSIEADPKVLASFGTDLTAQALQKELPRGYCLESSCVTVLRLLRREKWRSLALLGPAGSGKTALVNELVYRLAEPENGSWRVIRISPADFMAGTRYLGDWETKLRNLIEAARNPRRVVIYVPNLGDLSGVGSTDQSSNNIASALAPYLEDGSILLIGESTPEEFERGLGSAPTLKRLFDTVLVEEADTGQTLEILSAVRDEQNINLSDETLPRLLETAGQFLSHVSRPGNAVMLLRGVAQISKEAGRPVNLRDILDSLSKSTGVPADILDDSIPLNQGELRQWFERRIMGQAEAVDSVIDLVTLIKAGLTDPTKPFGVFLFIGPTGVGKTELAKALAEFIFGNPDRLKRFDMSEFASYEGFTRLIGKDNQPGLLTEAIRQHPFSVVLLDEIEKSHQNVFDLCLQIFDAGRLTDGQGRTVDFRRTIIILTSNIGAAVPTVSVGFHSGGTALPPESDKDRTVRELTRFFRPEFLNRIDRIVQFRPLSLEVAEQIARREIDQVLRRSGIRRRGIAVEVSPEVISLLVRDGYSPHFGARPLKRTVERLLLLPLARTISSGQLKGHTILHLVERSGSVQVSVTTGPEKAPPDTAIRTIASAASPERRVHALDQAYASLQIRVRPLADRKSELVLKTQSPGFYQDPVVRTATFDELHKLDQFLALHEGLGRALRSLTDHLQHASPVPTELPALGERIDQLQAELDQIDSIARSKDARDLGDVLLTISLVDRVGEPIDAVQKLFHMYEGLARRRRMSVDLLGESWDGQHDRVCLLVSGLGAYVLLRHEAGLHQLDWRRRQRKHRTGKEVTREDREMVRVEVLPVDGEPDKQFTAAVKSKVSILRPARQRLLKADLMLSLFHEPTLRSLELWCCGPRPEALKRCLLVLHASAKCAPPQSENTRVIRNYELGIAPKVKDVRTHRTTTRVDRVFKGYLDHFIFQPETPKGPLLQGND